MTQKKSMHYYQTSGENYYDTCMDKSWNTVDPSVFNCRGYP